MAAVAVVDPRFGVIVPVHNEASVIGDTAPALLADLKGSGAAVVFVCNGVTDGSDRILADVIGGHGDDPAAQVLVLPDASKTRALEAGEAALPVFPRFYVDADVTLGPGVLPRLADVLVSGAADLVSPRIAFDTSRATPLAAAMARLWLELPHGRKEAFHHVIGISASARKAWGAFPDILGDDAFIAAQVPADRRCLVEDVTINTLPPLSFWDLVRVRARWQKGHRQLRRMGVELPSMPGQRRELLSHLWGPGAAVAWAYLIARLLAALRSRLSLRAEVGRWEQSR